MIYLINKNMKNLVILLLTLLLLVKSFKVKRYNQSKFLKKNEKNEKTIEERYSKLSPLSIKSYLENKKVYLIDTRDYTISNLGYLPNSLLLPLTNSYQKWLPALINKGSNIVLICDETNYKESLNQTETLGKYNIFGYVIFDEIIKDNNFELRAAEYNDNTRKDVQKLVDKEKYLLDIREIDEFKETGVIKEAHLLPLSSFKDTYEKIPDDVDVYIFCKGGVRALLAMSFLQRAGYGFKLIVMRGGMSQTIKEEYPVVPYEE